MQDLLGNTFAVSFSLHLTVAMLLCCRYLGLFDQEVDAAMAFDRAAVKMRGLAAITNFDLSLYLDLLNPGAQIGVCNNLA